MRVINENIKNETYQKLIEYYFDKCDTVMFISNKDGFNDEEVSELIKSMNEMEDKLKKSYIKSINRSNWVFRIIGDSSVIKDSNFNQRYKIYFYKFTEEVKDYLLSNQNLYSWLNPKYPEDVSFFRNGWCLLSTITHEEMCDIEVETEEEYEYLKSIGIEFYEDKFTPTLKEYMYYEEI